jgi:hypothetical protein
MAIDARAVRLLEGESTQLGATWDGLGVKFSQFSANATKVELCRLETTSGRFGIGRSISFLITARSALAITVSPEGL